MVSVVHVIKVTSVAGAENHLLMLLAGLRARQIDLQVIMLVDPARPMDEFIEAIEGIPVHRVLIHRHLDFTLIPRLIKIIKRIKPDIVHTHLLHADLYGIPAARLSGVPVMISSRHNDNAFRRRTPVRQVNQILWRVTDAGIAISQSIAQFAIKIEGAPPEKIHVVPYGLAFQSQLPSAQQKMRQYARQKLGLDSNVVLVGMVCRLVEQKGVIYGLRAFQKVTQQFPDAYLLIAGDGPLRSSLEAQLLPLGLQGRVRFLGWRDDVSEIMAAFDVLLVPSLWEGFGLVLLEAMAQSLPIVAHAVSAIPEIIVDGETGLLVPAHDVDKMADALSLLLTDRALRRHMGMMGQERLEDYFTAEHMIDKTIAIYNQQLSGQSVS